MPVPDSDTFMRLLQDREKVLATLLGDMSSCAANAEAMGKLEDMLAAGAEVDQRKAMLALAKSMRHLNECTRRAHLLLLVYASGDNYTGDTAKVLSKMGRGEEALRAMFDQKMRGR